VEENVVGRWTGVGLGGKKGGFNLVKGVGSCHHRGDGEKGGGTGGSE